MDFNKLSEILNANFEVLKSKLDSLDTKISTVADKLASLQQESDGHSEHLKKLEKDVSIIRQENEKMASKMENYEKELKKKNLMIFNLKESESDGPGLKNYVKYFVDKELKATVNFDRVDKITRLGSKVSASPRPIRISFKEESDKWGLLSAAGNLKGTKHQTVSISQDYTVADRRKRRELVMFQKIAHSLGMEAGIRGFDLLVDGKKLSILELRNKFGDIGCDKEGYPQPLYTTPTPDRDEVIRREIPLNIRPTTHPEKSKQSRLANPPVKYRGRKK